MYPDDKKIKSLANYEKTLIKEYKGYRIVKGFFIYQVYIFLYVRCLMVVISGVNQQILTNQQIKKRLITNEYLKDTNNSNFQYCKEKRFSRDEDSKLQLLNVGSGLFASVVDTYSFFMGSKSGSTFSYRRYVEDFSTLGFFVYSVGQLDGKKVIEYQPAENYINNEGIDTLFRRYVDTTSGEIEEYILETTYVGGVIENKLYKSTSDALDMEDTTVPLDTIRETKDLDEYRDTGLEKVLYVCKEDITEQFPISTTDKIENIVYSIDRKILEVDLEFLKHGEVYKIFKNLDLPLSVKDAYSKGGSLDLDSLGHTILGTEQSSIEFVQNKNDMIADILIQNDKQVRMVSSTSSVPVDFLGLESKEGNIGQGSRTLLQGAFLKKILRLRSFMDKCFTDYEEVVGGVVREDIFVKSDNELVLELKEAREAGLISQLNAIVKYTGLELDEAKKELEEINGEALPEIKEDANTIG